MQIQDVQALCFVLLYNFLNFKFLCGVEILFIDIAYSGLISCSIVFLVA